MLSHGESALRSSPNRPFFSKTSHFETLYQANLLAINVGDLNGRIVDANDAFLRMVGYSRTELEANELRWDRLAANESREADRVAMSELKRVGYSPLREKTYVHKNGTLIPTLVGVTLLEAPNRSVAVVVDISKQQESLEKVAQAKKELEARVAERTARLQHSNEELLQVQDRLRSLAVEKFFAEERERRRIAEGLHDRVAQNLAVARMRLSTIDELDSKSARQVSQQAAEEIGEAIQAIRTMIFEINPPVLYDLGLVSAIEWLIDDFRSKYGFNCELRAEGHLEPIDEAVSVALFQSLRELLFNVIKHAGAQRTTVRVQSDLSYLKLVVHDDGCGFVSREETIQMESGGYGLFNIRDRLSLLGGTLAIESCPSAGTEVTISVPIKKQ